MFRSPVRAFAQLRSPVLTSSPKLEPFVDRLPRLPVLTGSVLELAARNSQHKFHRDLPSTPTFAYGNSTYLGPVIEAQSYVTTELTFSNALGAHVLARDIDTTLHGVTEADRTSPRTVLHLHGGVTAPASDGHPAATILPGTSERHVYTNRQEAAGLWYHDHTMGMTRINCYAGLAGMYLLRDRWDTGLQNNPLGLPAGEHELPLVLTERTFNGDGTLQLRGIWLVPQGSWEGGTVGDTGVVNGVVWPEILVDRGMYRLRLVNGGSNSVWNLYFSNSMTFWVIGGDGGLLDAPVAVRSIRLSPGERVDLLVPFGDLAAGETVRLLNDEPVPLQAAVFGVVPMPLFCQFRANAALGFQGAVPRTLRGGTNQPPRLASFGPPRRIRDVTLGQFTDLSRFPPAMMGLNNVPFDTEDMERPMQGTVERWNLVNITDDPHPIHIHLITFQVLGRQALDTNAYLMANPRPPFGTYWAPPPDKFLRGSFVPRGEHEAGPKDTVIADAHSVTSILVRWPTAAELGFDPDATHMPRHDRGGHGSHPLQGYVWHCHLFDHEDHDMMQPFRLLSDPDAPAPVHDGEPHDSGGMDAGSAHPPASDAGHEHRADAGEQSHEGEHPFDAGEHDHAHLPHQDAGIVGDVDAGERAGASSDGCSVQGRAGDNGVALAGLTMAAVALARSLNRPMGTGSSE